MKKIISWALRHIPRKYLQRVVQLAVKLVSVFYIGKKVECTVCGSHFRKFLPYGRVDSRENALCPSCLSLERHRLLYRFLQEKTNFFTANLSVLHVAPEICFIKRFKNMPNLDYKTADIESPWADIRMDIMDIKLPENTFDVIFCNHVLEHVPNDLVAMKQFYRVLKPGGWAILQSPIYYHLETTYEDPTITDPKEREKHFGQDDHHRIFGRDYADRLREAGFVVEEDDAVKKMTAEERYKYGFEEHEIIYLCKKVA